MDRANKTASTAVYGGLGVGAAVILALSVFLELVLRWAGALDSVMPYAVAYTRIYLVFSIFNVFNVTMNNIVSSEGAAKAAMCALLAGAALNVALDPVFIYGLDLGVLGAAIATAISQVVSSLVYICYILRRRSVFSFRLRDCCFSWDILSEILKIGVPTLVFQMLSSLSVSMTNSAAKEYGPSALAAMGPAAKIMSMGSLTVFGFLKGFQPVAGFSYGAKKFDRLREAVKISVLWSTAFCLVFGLIIGLFSGQIMGLFTKGDEAMIRTGAAALRASGATFVLFGFYTVCSFLFLVIGKAKEGCILGACRQGICFIPAILFLPAVRGLDGVVCAQPAADVLSALTAAALAARLHRQLKAEEADIQE